MKIFIEYDWIVHWCNNKCVFSINLIKYWWKLSKIISFWNKYLVTHKTIWTFFIYLNFKQFDFFINFEVLKLITLQLYIPQIYLMLYDFFSSQSLINDRNNRWYKFLFEFRSFIEYENVWNKYIPLSNKFGYLLKLVQI